MELNLQKEVDKLINYSLYGQEVFLLNMIFKRVKVDKEYFINLV